MAQDPATRPEKQSLTCPPAKPEMQEWFKPWQFGAILAVLIVVCFPQVIAGFETFYLSDYSTFGYPLAHYHREAFWRGEMPLWNPLNNCGMPFLAQWNTLTLYPLSLIYLLLPMPWSLGIFCLAHLFLAGMGMYYLAFRWTGHRLAGAVAGTIFAFNGLTWFGLMWPNNIAALGWMPWTVLAVERSWRADSTRFMPLAGMAAAMQMLAGAPEVCLQTWFFIGLLWHWTLIRNEVSRSRLLWRAAALGILVFGLSAAQMLPFLDLLGHSQRNASFGDARTMAMPLGGWANYLVPLFHTARGAAGIHWQVGQTWTASYFLGTGAIALALFGVWRARGLKAGFLAGVALFSMWMALGGNGYLYPLLLKLFPPIGFMRFPVKFVVLATFTIPLLAACGVSWFQSRSTQAWRPEWKMLKIIATILLAAMVVILFIAWKNPLASGALSEVLKNAGVRAVFLVLVVGCLHLAQIEKDGKLRQLWPTGVVLMLWFDVFTHAPNLSPTVPSALLAPDTIRQYFGWKEELQPGVSRALQEKNSFWTMLAQTSPDPVVDLNGRRLSLFFNLNLLDHVSKFDGFYSLDLREFSDVFKQIYFGTNASTSLKNFMGVSHVTNPTNSVDWLPRGSALPIVSAGQSPLFVPPEKTLETVLSDGFDPTHMVCLSDVYRGQIAVTNGGKARILGTRFSAQRVEAEVEAEAPSMVVVAQAFYHPWQAYVGDQQVKLLQANHAFQALEVPAGHHRVVLLYRDTRFMAGCALSILTFLVSVVWLWRTRCSHQISPTSKA